MDNEWMRARAQALQRLNEDVKKGRVDADIVEFLIKFNEGRECLFTTSSCSGRVVVMVGKDFFDKQGVKTIFVTHTPDGCLQIIDRLETVLREFNNIGYAWISLQPPILHVATSNRGVAETIVRCGVKSGFIRACYRERKSTGYHVEIAAHDKLHVMLPANKQALKSLCDALDKYKAKLKNLIQCLLGIECF